MTSNNGFHLFVLALTLIAFGVLDVYLLLASGPESTLSASILELSARYPLVPLLLGILLGHLFWPQR